MLDVHFVVPNNFPNMKQSALKFSGLAWKLFFVRATTLKALINLGPQLLSVIANVLLRALCVSLLLGRRASLGQVVVQEAKGMCFFGPLCVKLLLGVGRASLGQVVAQEARECASYSFWEGRGSLGQVVVQEARECASLGRCA